MAYGELYRHNFKTMNTAASRRLSILEDGYGGSVTEKNGGASPVKIITGDGSVDKYKTIYGTEAVVTLMSETNYEFRDMITDDETDYILQVKSGSSFQNIDFQGFMITDQYVEKYTDTPNEITFSFVDGLGRLKGITYTTGNIISTTDKSDLKTSTVAIMDVLTFCFDKLNWGYDIYEICNIYEDSMDATADDSPLKQTYVNEERYYDIKIENGVETYYPWSCHRVIEAVLKPLLARIWIQRRPGDANPSWNIATVNELVNNHMVRRQFNSSGTLIGSETVNYAMEIGNPSDSYWYYEPLFLSSNHVLEFDNIYRKLVTRFDPGELVYGKGKLVGDWSFEDWSSTKRLNQWTGTLESNDFVYKEYGDFDLAKKEHEPYHNIFRALLTNDNTPFGGSTTIDSSSYYITQSSFYNLQQTGNDIQVTFNLQPFWWATTYPVNDWIYTPVFRWAIKVGTKYLVWNDSKNYSWTTTPTINRTRVWEKIYYPENQTQYLPWLDAVEFSVRATLDSNGDFEIRLYPPDQVAYLRDTQTLTTLNQLNPRETIIDETTCAILVDAIRTKLIVNDDAGRDLVLINTEASNTSTVPEIEYEVVHGDLDNVLNAGVFTLSDGSVTSTWYTRGNSENVGILQLISNLLVENYKQPTAILKGTFQQGSFLDFSSILNIHEGATVYQYICTQLEFDVRTGWVTGTWVQNLDTSFDNSYQYESIGINTAFLEANGAVDTFVSDDPPLANTMKAGVYDAFGGNIEDAGELAQDTTFDGTTDAAIQKMQLGANVMLNLENMNADNMTFIISQGSTGGFQASLGGNILGEDFLEVNTDPYSSTMVTLKKVFNTTTGAKYIVQNTFKNLVSQFEVLEASVSLTSNDLLNLNYSPYELLPAKANTFYYILWNPVFLYTHGGTDYDTSDNPLLLRFAGADTHFAFLDTSSAQSLQATTSQSCIFETRNNVVTTNVVVNAAVQIYCNVDPVDGDGSAKVNFFYIEVDG